MFSVEIQLQYEFAEQEDSEVNVKQENPQNPFDVVVDDDDEEF